MAKCPKCGNVVPDTHAYCPVCGENLQYNTYDSSNNNSYYTGSEDMTNMFSQQDIQNNKVMAALSYLGILVVVPLLANRDSKFVRFHTIQGLNLFILSSIINIIERVGGWFINHVFTLFKWPWYGVFDLLNLVLFVFFVLGIYNVCKGRARELPIIGRIHLLRL